MGWRSSIWIKGMMAAAWIGSGPVGYAQVTTWSERGEQGLAHVIDRTSAAYPLLQSDIVAEGQFAFHLAHPELRDESFELDQTFSITPTTSLFFSSRLGAATADQVARVRLSTDGGATWPFEVFSQAGNDFPGEGSFHLESIDLSSFAGQQARFEFLYDYRPPGEAYPQTDAIVGWLIDDIQIGASVQKPQYLFGDPTPRETQYLEFVNRSRADALGEARRLAAETDPSIREAIKFFGVDTKGLEAQFAWQIDHGCIDETAQPLAFNDDLMRMATLHSTDQRDHNFQGHISSNLPPAPFQPGDTLTDRADRVGYGWVTLGENVYAGARSVAYGEAAFEIDWGQSNASGDACFNPAFLNQGMQNPPFHRINLHNDDFKEIGVGTADRTDGLHVVTQDLASPGNARFATGVVYVDRNSNSFYDPGEGVAGVTIDSDDSSYFAVSSASGAYSLPLSHDGQHWIRFTGTDGTTYQENVSLANGKNIKVDYLVGQPTPVAGDFDGNRALDVLDLNLLSVAVRDGGAVGTFDLNGDQQLTSADRERWIGELRRTYIGDANLDGQFDSEDLITAFIAGQYEDDVVGNSRWETGDFDGDADFASADFVYAFQDGGYEQGPRAARPLAAVPEPAALAAPFWLACFWGRRLRRSASVVRTA